MASGSVQSTSNYIVTDSFESGTITVAANSNKSTSINVNKTGYTAVAIAGIRSFSSAFVLAEFGLTNVSVINIAGYNVSNAQISGTITVRVLYVRN